MSLSTADLNEIRNIIESALTKQTETAIKPIQGEIEALRNDISEIYDMIATLQRSAVTDPKFKKLSIEMKLLALNAELLEAARQVGLTLPR